MSRGDHPNSRKNLEKGKATRFVKGDTRAKLGNPASIKAQAQKRSLQECAEIIGHMKGSPEVANRLSGIFPNLTKEGIKTITNNMLMMMRLCNEVLIKGNMQALNLWCELTGQKATQKHEVTTHQEIDINKVKDLKKLLDTDKS